MLTLFGSLSLTVFVISVTAPSPNAQMNMSFIFTSSSSLKWFKTSSSFFIMVKSMSLVIFTYWLNLLHEKFASRMVFFSEVGEVIFWCCFIRPFLSDSSLEELRPVWSFVVIFELFEVILTAPCCISWRKESRWECNTVIRPFRDYKWYSIGAYSIGRYYIKYKN